MKIRSLLLLSELRVNLGIEQGTINSPTIYNNGSLRDLLPCCILNRVSGCVLFYADDDLSRAVFSSKKKFKGEC